MAKPVPINREAPFNVEELFFSLTDARGIIQSGNDVFVRVSSHPREALIGAPHNIIRHPDMPKAVFRVFWKTIQAGKPISAYVKNMAADGAYYWVFATVFPVEGGYLSIRIKPQTQYFKLIPTVYHGVLEREKKEGIDAGVAQLLELLKGAGFSDYEKFMNAAILAEISGRSKVVAAMSTNSAGDSASATGDEDVLAKLNEIARRCTASATENARILSKLEHFSEMNKQLTEKSAFILKTLQTLDLLAVNMSTAARRIGSAGVTLVAVANGIQKSAGEFKEDLKKFNESARGVEASIHSSEVQIATSQLQVDMIDFYVKELLKKLQNGMNLTPDELRDMQSNSKLLLGLSDASSKKLVVEMDALKKVLIRISMDVEQLRSTINGLEIVRKTGGIEAAQIHDGDQFTTHFQVMSDVVRDTGKQLGTFGDSVHGSLQDIDQINPALSRIGTTLAELSMLNERIV